MCVRIERLCRSPNGHRSFDLCAQSQSPLRPKYETDGGRGRGVSRVRRHTGLVMHSSKGKVGDEHTGKADDNTDEAEGDRDGGVGGDYDRS